jgi:hypothetical protein
MPSPKQGSAAAIAGKNGHSLISNDKFRQLFHALVASQGVNDYLRTLGKPSPVANREAGPAGLVLDLRPEDTILLPTPTHFAHRVKGKALKEVLAEAEAASNDKLGKRLAEAIAVAVQHRMEKNSAIVLTLFELPEENENGLSAYDEVFSVAWASKLPILFVLESQERILDSVKFKEMHPALPFITVDAHDIVAVYRVAQESIVRTREGAGPAVIELAPFSGDGAGAVVDPVEKMHGYLRSKGLPVKRWEADARRRFEKELRGLSSQG